MKILIIKYKNEELECLIDTSDEQLVSAYNWKYHPKTGVIARHQNKTIYLHRLLTDCPIGLVVDHIDHNHLNNVRSNLRICSQSNNSKNSKRPKNNTSGFKGVQHHPFRNGYALKKPWRALIKVNRKVISLGYFTSKEGAARAYDKAAKLYFGEFADLNY